MEFKQEIDIKEEMEIQEGVTCNVKPIEIKSEKVETFKGCTVHVKPIDIKSASVKITEVK